MAKFVRNWRLKAVQDHLDELESIVHDLKDLCEVDSLKELASIDVWSIRDNAYWCLALIRGLLGLKHK